MNAYDHALAILDSGMIPACLPMEIDDRPMVVVIPWAPANVRGRRLLSARTHPQARSHFICESMVRCRRAAEKMDLGEAE